MKQIKPAVMYNKYGDLLEIYNNGEGIAFFAERINEWLTICKSIIDRKTVVGIIITGFRHRFDFVGLKIDENYDETPPLTDDDRQEIDKFIEQLRSNKK